MMHVRAAVVGLVAGLLLDFVGLYAAPTLYDRCFAHAFDLDRANAESMQRLDRLHHDFHRRWYVLY